MSRSTISEVLAAYLPRPSLALLTPRQGVLMALALTALAVVLLQQLASAPALAAWATALLVISAALPCLLSVATAVGMTGVGVLLINTGPLTLNTPEWIGMGLIGALAFGAGHALARVHRLRMKIADRNARLTLKSAVLEQVVEQHSDGIALFDGTGRVLAHNQRYRALMGADTDSTLTAIEWTEQSETQPRHALRALFEQALRNGAAQGSVSLGTQLGTADLRIVTRPSARGILLMCVLRAPEDSPHRSTSFPEQDQLAALAEARGEGLIVCDARWHIVSANTPALQWAGCNDATALREMPLWNGFAPFTRSWCDITGERLTRGQPERREHFDAHSRSWYEVVAFPWNEGFAVLYRDISADRHRAMQDLENATRWELVHSTRGWGEWSFDLDLSEFRFCATARHLLGLAPDCERIAKATLLERVDHNDRLRLVQSIIALTSAPSAPLDIEVRVTDPTASDGARRLRWLGRFAADPRSPLLYGVMRQVYDRQQT